MSAFGGEIDINDLEQRMRTQDNDENNSQRHTYKNLDNNIKVLQNIIEQYEEGLKIAKRHLHDLMCFKDSCIIHNNYKDDDFLQVNDNRFRKFFMNCYKIYLGIHNIYTSFYVPKKYYKSDSNIDEFNKVIQPLKADVIEKTIYIKLPRLPKRTYYLRNDFFVKEVRQMMFNLKKQGKLPDKIKWKRIHILNVYPSEYNPSFIPDSDNLDFKRLIDMITSFIGDDSGLHTFYSLETYQTDKIEEGCYIIVEPIEEPKILHKLEKIGVGFFEKK